MNPIDWLRASHHWQHLAGGFLIGLAALQPWAALYAAAAAGGAMELKDVSYGDRWSWADFLLTLGGGAAAAALWLFEG